jgi:aspartate 1-decarboxylase
MLRTMYKSKIHRATLTDADLHYEGSATIDSDLLQAADIMPYEKVQIVNINTGGRLETYVIEGEPGSGAICLNGAAARLGEPGDMVIIISYAEVADLEARDWEPTTILVDEKNRVKSGGKSTVQSSAGNGSRGVPQNGSQNAAPKTVRKTNVPDGIRILSAPAKTATKSVRGKAACGTSSPAASFDKWDALSL